MLYDTPYSFSIGESYSSNTEHIAENISSAICSYPTCWGCTESFGYNSYTSSVDIKRVVYRFLNSTKVISTIHCKSTRAQVHIWIISFLYINVSSMKKRKRIYLIYLKKIAKTLLRQLSEKSDKSVSLIIFNVCLTTCIAVLRTIYF